MCDSWHDCILGYPKRKHCPPALPPGPPSHRRLPLLPRHLQIKPHVNHTWVAVGALAAAAGSRGGDTDQDVADECLLAAITSDPDYLEGKARVLVFTSNVRNADRVS